MQTAFLKKLRNSKREIKKKLEYTITTNGIIKTFDFCLADTFATFSRSSWTSKKSSEENPFEIAASNVLQVRCPSCQATPEPNSQKP